MNAGDVNRMEQHDKDEKLSLKGTLFSVLMVGGFIGLLWIAIFWLYMARV